MKRKYGASILEMILTVGLFGVVLAVLASLLTDSMQITRRADELTWSNRAAHWLDQMEMDAAAAKSLNVAAGSSDSELVAEIRDINSPTFLPSPAPDPWNPDEPAFQISRTYKIEPQGLTLVVQSPTIGTGSYLLGSADRLSFERSTENILTITIGHTSEEVRREVPLFLLDSEKAPL